MAKDPKKVKEYQKNKVKEKVKKEKSEKKDRNEGKNEEKSEIDKKEKKKIESHKKSLKISKQKEKETKEIKSKKAKETIKRKWQEKDKITGKRKSYKSGKITPEEEKIIEQSLCQYAFDKNLTNDELLSIITEKLKNDNKIWPVIAECLPDRSVQSIHNFCHRKYHPNNYKGFWTSKEEKDLINLVKEYGKKWTLIGAKLERTPTNVKDKYKELGAENNSLVTKDNSLIHILKLLKAINNNVFKKENSNEKYNIFKYTYKFNDKVDEKYDNFFKLIKAENGEEKFLIDSSIKMDSSEVITRNILKRIIDLDNLALLVDEKKEIPWSLIIDDIDFYSIDTCRNQYKRILNMLGIESASLIKKDLLLVSKLIDLDYDNADEINWNYIKAKRKPEENKERFNELIKSFDPFGIKKLGEILTEIKSEFEKELQKKTQKEENDDENEEEEQDKDEMQLKDEISRRNKNNIIKIYQKYKQSRGFGEKD